MPESSLCVRCGSDAVIPRARLAERGDDNRRFDLEAEVQRRPNALLFKRPERTTLWARICGACGHAELYADSPGVLYAAYQQTDGIAAVSTLEELERTREALADAHLRLEELQEQLAFVERLVKTRDAKAPPPPATK